MNKLKKLVIVSSILNIVTLLFILFIIALSIFWIGSIFDVEQGGWTTIGFLYIFSPITTVVAILLLIIPCYYLKKSRNDLRKNNSIWVGFAGIIIIWVETFILMYLRLGIMK